MPNAPETVGHGFIVIISSYYRVGWSMDLPRKMVVGIITRSKKSKYNYCSCIFNIDLYWCLPQVQCYGFVALRYIDGSKFFSGGVQKKESHKITYRSGRHNTELDILVVRQQHLRS